MKKLILPLIAISLFSSLANALNFKVKHITRNSDTKNKVKNFYTKHIAGSPGLSKEKKQNFLQAIKKDSFFDAMFPISGKQFAAINDQDGKILGLLSIRFGENKKIADIGGPIILLENQNRGLGKALLSDAIQDTLRQNRNTHFYTQAKPCPYCLTSKIFCELFGTCGHCPYSWFIKQGFKVDFVMSQNSRANSTKQKVLVLTMSSKQARKILTTKKNK